MTADLLKRFTRDNIDSIGVTLRGVMEQWSDGVLGIDQHSSTPILHFMRKEEHA